MPFAKCLSHPTNSLPVTLTAVSVKGCGVKLYERVNDTIVRNQFPQCEPGAVRLAVVGESPAESEVSWRVCASGHGYAGRHWENRQLVTRDRCNFCGSQRWEERPTPFVGESGKLLDTLLKDAGLPRERCFVGNASQRPLSEGEKDLDHCKGGLARLWRDLEAFKPTLVLCLGGLSLSAFHPQGAAAKPSNWRGSLFDGELQGSPYRCVAAMHPAAILREPSQTCLLRFDVARAVQEATAPSPPLVRTITAPNELEAVGLRLAAIRGRKAPVGYDLEGDHKCITVCSFATSPTEALSIPLRNRAWAKLWSDADEARIMRAVGDVLEDPAVPKVCHNASFETFVHRWLYSHRLRSPEDSMIAWNCAYPELDKNLSVVASILTRQPYWGEAGYVSRDNPMGWTDDADRDTYNAIDSCVCLEAWQRLMAEFTPEQLSYYKTQRDLLEPCGAMSFEGLAYDAKARDELVARLEREVYEAQGKLDALAGIQRPAFREVVEAVAFKKAWDKCADWNDVLLHSKPSYR